MGRRTTRATFALVSVLCLLLGACSSDNQGDADDRSEDAGPAVPHPHDQTPAAGTVWVQNGDVATASEYWIIFRESSGTHYLYPRPDGDPLIAAACAAPPHDATDEGSDAAFVRLARELQLCQGAATSAAVQRINALSLDEATQISTWLHQHLRFETTETGVWPYPLVSDQIRICTALDTAGAFQDVGGDNTPALADLCAWHLGRLGQSERTDIARILSEAEATALADELNRLYEVVAGS